MNEKTQKRKRSGLIVGMLLCIALAGVVIAFVHFAHFDPSTAPDAGNASTQTMQTSPTVHATDTANQPLEDLAVEAPFCTLYYPGKWSGQVRTELVDLGYGYVIRFFGTSGGQEAALFSIQFAFGSENAAQIGTITKNGIATDVYLETEPAPAGDSWAQQYVDEICAMQADVSHLIAKMSEDPFFSLPEAEQEQTEIPGMEDALIETPYCTLYYPAQWKDKASWETASGEKGCTVTVSGAIGDQICPVFKVSFDAAAENGFLMGTFMFEGEPVNVCLTLIDPPADAGWTDSQRSLFTTLQEGAYYMLDKLAENPRYTSALG